MTTHNGDATASRMGALISYAAVPLKWGASLFLAADAGKEATPTADPARHGGPPHPEAVTSQNQCNEATV